MLGVIGLVLGGFATLIYSSYRRSTQSGRYQPEGKLRWTDSENP